MSDRAASVPDGTGGSGGQTSAAGVGRRSVSGLAWLLGDTLASKFVGIAAQAVLAQLLVPEEFGLYAIVLAIVTVAELAGRSGLRDVLIAKKDEFGRLSSGAVWLSGGLGVASSFVVLGIGGVLYATGREELGGLTMLASVAPLLSSVIIVPEAHLASSFRFRTLALAHLVRALARAALSVGFVAMGLGVAGLVGALLLSAAGVAVWLWLASRAPVSGRPEPSVWRELAPGMSLLFLSGLIATIGAQGDYLIIGWIAGEDAVGLYFMAFTLGSQVVLLFATNLSRVLMPAMSHLSGDLPRQGRALVEACGGLALIGGLVCGLQAGLALPIVRSLTRDIYEPAALPMAALAGGMFFRLLSFASTPLMKAQERFWALLVLQSCAVATILGLAALGTWLGMREGIGAAFGCALGVGVASVLVGLAGPWVALAPTGRGLGSVVSAVGVPLVGGLVCAGAAWSIGPLFEATRVGAVVHLVAGIVLGTAVYAVFVCLLVPGRVRTLLDRLSPLWSRVGPLRALAGRLDDLLSRTRAGGVEREAV